MKRFARLAAAAAAVITIGTMTVLINAEPAAAVPVPYCAVTPITVGHGANVRFNGATVGTIRTVYCSSSRLTWAQLTMDPDFVLHNRYDAYLNVCDYTWDDSLGRYACEDGATQSEEDYTSVNATKLTTLAVPIDSGDRIFGSTAYVQWGLGCLAQAFTDYHDFSGFDYGTAHYLTSCGS